MRLTDAGTDYGRALMLSACLTASLASGGARAQQTLPDIQIGEAGPLPSAPAPYTGGRDAAEHPQYLPATVSMSAFGDQPPRDTPHSVNVITEDMLLDQEVKTVNEALSYLPSVIIRDQQGQDLASAVARVPGQRRPEYAHRRHEHHWPDRLRGRGF